VGGPEQVEVGGRAGSGRSVQSTAPPGDSVTSRKPFSSPSPTTSAPTSAAASSPALAAHLADHVLPPLPLRQWVFSLPKRIRPFLPHDPRLAGDVLGVLLRAIRTTLRRASPPAPTDAQLGAISFLHRFGSALNTHFHFHVVVLDGVFSRRGTRP
jgi:hypothetical protein